jgi:glutathione S-transferase
MIAPSLTLISHYLCPFVQRAAIVLNEKSVPFQRINVDLTAKPDWFLAISPMGKVPLLKVRQDDGVEVTLFESMAICEYLEDTQGDVKLHPAGALARAQHRAWIEYGSATLTEAWGFLNAKDQATEESKGKAFREKLAGLEGVLGDGPYFAGASFSLVDVVFAPIFRYFDLLQVGATVFKDLGSVKAWREALEQRPSVISAVGRDYSSRLRDHLRRQGALLAT